MLAGIAGGSIEDLAETLDYSGRHMQRLFGALLSDLGLATHRDALVAAVKWGIAGRLDLPSSGARARGLDPSA